MLRKALLISLLILSFATAVTWIVSIKRGGIWFTDKETLENFLDFDTAKEVGDRQISIWIGGGNFQFGYVLVVDSQRGIQYRSFDQLPGIRLITQNLLIDKTSRINWSIGQIHLLYPFAMFSAFPLIGITGPVLRHKHRKRRGLCLQCSYNLEGNATGVCPECGDQSSGTKPSDTVNPK